MADPYGDDERTTELATIAAIYPELQIAPDDPYSASLDLEVTPVKPLKIRFQEALADPAPPQLPTPPSSNKSEIPALKRTAADTNGRDAVGAGIHELEHLPRLQISVQLPATYPAEQPPLVELSVSPAWLGQEKMRELKRDCERLWQEIGRDQVIFMFIDHLQSGAENAFGLADGEAVSVPADLRLELLDFDQKAKRRKFESGTFDCGICLEPKKGKDCHRLMMCGHVFCVPCLQDFYNNCITEGDVDSVKCIDPGCGKNTTPGEAPRKKRRRDQTLNPSELLQIPIQPDQVKRYVQLKRKKKLESDKTTIYCPRQWCQGAARSKKHPKPTDLLHDFSSDSDPEGEAQEKSTDPEAIALSARLAVCEDCDFAFCCVCKKSWHGEWGHCAPRRTKEMEEEEKRTMAYLKHFSTPCPTCAAPAQKSHGCNHMICFRCKTHFCYLCSAYLTPENPYNHFNTEGTQCYMRLWELEGGDGEGAPDRGFILEWNDPIANAPQEAAPPPDHAINMAELAQQVEAVVANPAANVVDDSDDEEVAPDVNRHRRERAIEFVNFAAPGGQQNQRVILPDQVEEPAAQPQVDAPAPARPNGTAANRRRQRQRRRPQARDGRPARAP